MNPKHVELFIRNDGSVVAQCRTETNGRLDDPVPLSTAGEVWDQFKADWSAAQLQQIADLTAERDAALAATETVRAELQAEVDRLTALIPPPREDYQVTRSEFLARLQQADPQVIVDIWKSQSAESILAAVSMFTHDGVIDLRPGQRTHLMLQSLIPLGIITAEQVASLLIEV